jgi:hypothetical protein
MKGFLGLKLSFSGVKKTMRRFLMVLECWKPDLLLCGLHFKRLSSEGNFFLF